MIIQDRFGYAYAAPDGQQFLNHEDFAPMDGAPRIKDHLDLLFRVFTDAPVRADSGVVEVLPSGMLYSRAERA